MPAGIYNIQAEQGSTLTRTVTWTDSTGSPIDLTSYTARMHVRVEPHSASTILVLTTENGGLILGGSTGTISLQASATTTAALSGGSYVYDLELVSGGVVTRLLQGSFYVSLEVTK